MTHRPMAGDGSVLESRGLTLPLADAELVQAQSQVAMRFRQSELLAHFVLLLRRLLRHRRSPCWMRRLGGQLPGAVECATKVGMTTVVRYQKERQTNTTSRMCITFCSE